MSRSLRVLIVGAGIAGAAVATLLVEAGHEVHLIERDPNGRSTGNPVDVRGPALQVARQLGILDQVRQADTGARRLEFVDRLGHVKAGVRLRSDHAAEIEIDRQVLAQILLDRAAGRVDIRHGTGPESIHHTRDTVQVRLTDGSEVESDLLIGADGHHSTVRRLAFDDTGVRHRDLDLVLATVRTGQPESDPTTIRMLNIPNASLTVHPAGGRPGAAFIFRSSIPVPGDLPGRRELLRRTYGHAGWRAPQLLDAVDSTPDLFMDRVSRISTASWTTGRTVLLGDAAASVSILANGSSMALEGALRLAEALHDNSSIPSALAAYQHIHRPTVQRSQRVVRWGAWFLVPHTAAGVNVRNAAARMIRHV